MLGWEHVPERLGPRAPGWAVYVFVAASHQTRLDTRSKARRPIKVGIKGRGRSGTSRDSNPACLCCSSVHLVQCEPDEASSFTNPNVGPGTYASLRLKLDAWSSAVHGWQRVQKCSSPARRLPSRSWGPIRPRVCSWFRPPIRHECQTTQRSTPSTHTQTFQIKWEVYFSKNCVARLYYCVNMYSTCIYVYMHIYHMWLYNTWEVYISLYILYCTGICFIHL